MNTANVEISWNVKATAPNKSIPAWDKPFIIGRMDLSVLNSSLGTHFKPMVWIAIPRN